MQCSPDHDLDTVKPILHGGEPKVEMTALQALPESRHIYLFGDVPLTGRLMS